MKTAVRDEIFNLPKDDPSFCHMQFLVLLRATKLRLLKFKARKDLMKMSGLLDGGRDGGRGDIGL